MRYITISHVTFINNYKYDNYYNIISCEPYGNKEKYFVLIIYTIIICYNYISYILYYHYINDILNLNTGCKKGHKD